MGNKGGCIMDKKISKISAVKIYKKLNKIDAHIEYLQLNMFEKKQILVKNFYNADYSLNSDLSSNQLVKKIMSCHADFEKIRQLIYDIMFDVPEIDEVFIKEKSDGYVDLEERKKEKIVKEKLVNFFGKEI
tara:strand:- start:43 stop:435 length:393 start_codon:yes stop_codon:yes gene_type:complete